MKQSKILMLAATMAAFITMSSCTLETSDNGDLDGFWHLERVDTLDTGGVCELSDELIFWGVQMRLIHVADHGKNVEGYMMHFEYSGNALRLYDMHLNDRLNGDPELEDAAELAPFGINALEENYTIENLNSSDMKLRTDKLRLHLHKM